MASNEAEETIKHLSTIKGVLGLLVINGDGIPIKSTLPDNNISVHYAALISDLLRRCHLAIRELDSQNELTFLRLNSKKHEILVAPEREYTLIVVQKPSCD